jgi:hypothetical protein
VDAFHRWIQRIHTILFRLESAFSSISSIIADIPTERDLGLGGAGRPANDLEVRELPPVRARLNVLEQRIDIVSKLLIQGRAHAAGADLVVAAPRLPCPGGWLLRRLFHRLAH